MGVLTEIFFENGFDVKENSGHNGASCLLQLCRSFYDQYILDVAELLLDTVSIRSRRLQFHIGIKMNR